MYKTKKIMGRKKQKNFSANQLKLENSNEWSLEVREDNNCIELLPLEGKGGGSAPSGLIENSTCDSFVSLEFNLVA